MNLDIKEKEKNQKPEDKKYLGVQIPTSMYDELQKRSEEEWLSVSDIIRRLIRDYLKGGNK